jgi:hypothetical protein
VDDPPSSSPSPLFVVGFECECECECEREPDCADVEPFLAEVPVILVTVWGVEAPKPQSFRQVALNLGWKMKAIENQMPMP